MNNFFAAGKKTFNIDHHVSNPAYADVNFVDSDSSATAQIIFRVLTSLGAIIDEDLATLLLSGIVDDTGSYRYSNTTEDVFRCSAELVKLGANPELIANTLYFSTPKRVAELRKLALAELKLFAEGRIGMIVVTKDMLAKAEAELADTEGLVEEARSIEGVIVAVLVRELDDKWRVSLRSKDPNCDVNKVASNFDGGGHKAAAGCSVVGSKEDVEEQILNRVIEEL